MADPPQTVHQSEMETSREVQRSDGESETRRWAATPPSSRPPSPSPSVASQRQQYEQLTIEEQRAFAFRCAEETRHADAALRQREQALQEAQARARSASPVPPVDSAIEVMRKENAALQIKLGAVVTTMASLQNGFALVMQRMQLSAQTPTPAAEDPGSTTKQGGIGKPTTQQESPCGGPMDTSPPQSPCFGHGVESSPMESGPHMNRPYDSESFEQWGRRSKEADAIKF